MNDPTHCPTCGGWNQSLDAPEGERYCTPITCSSWTFTHRLTKQGPKPIRPDGRADLASVASKSSRPGEGNNE